jgi:Reverse transcriptase (RNA-dependent DNA polymerase)
VECVLIGYETSSKAYRCYHRSSQRVFSSYHVAFIESHDASPRLLHPGVVLGDSATVHDNVVLDSPLDLPETPRVEAPLVHAPAAIPVDIPIPVGIPTPCHQRSGAVDLGPDEVRRSNRVREPSARAAASQDLPCVSQVERATQEARESAQSVEAQHTEQRRLRVQAQEEVLAQFSNSEDLPMLEELFAALEDSPVNITYPEEPVSVKEALGSSEGKEWSAALQDEFKSLKEMGVYKLVPRSHIPQGRKVMRGKGVFLRKRDETGAVVRYKARWVIRSFEQIFGQDYNKTSSPTARMESFRVLLHLGAALDYDMQQIDVKTAFLNGLLPEGETVYMEQPAGFEEPGFEDHVWELQKGLYGLKQVGRIWNRAMNEAMVNWGFTRLSCEYCIYYRRSEAGDIIFAAVHVDDFLSVASSRAENERFKTQLKEIWTISGLGDAKFCIGIAIECDRKTRTVALSQKALIDHIISQFGLSDAYPVSTPMDPGVKLSRVSPGPVSEEAAKRLALVPYRALVGSLLYVSMGTHPDISFAVQQLSQFLDCYNLTHWEAAKRVVHYLKGTRNLKLHLGGPKVAELVGYTDSSFANCVDTRKSVSGYCFTLGSGVISWAARKQKTVSTSSCESEYVAASDASKETVWLRALLLGLCHPQRTPTPLRCDNNGAIVLTGDPSFHSRVKHIDVKYHYIRELVENGTLDVRYVNTKLNVADVFTKALAPKPFAYMRRLMGLY